MGAIFVTRLLNLYWEAITLNIRDSSNGWGTIIKGEGTNKNNWCNKVVIKGNGLIIMV